MMSMQGRIQAFSKGRGAQSHISQVLVWSMLVIGALKAQELSGVQGHAPQENFENWGNLKGHLLHFAIILEQKSWVGP